MPTANRVNTVSIDDYLADERTAEVRREYIDGSTYAMAGASKNHDTIALNLLSDFKHHLKKSLCRPFSSDVKVKTATGNFRYPDCMVVCEDDSDNDYYVESPVILVEVLSHSTRRIDEKDKLLEYINIPSLKEYVIVEQDIADIRVYRKSDHWRSTHYFLGEEIYFESIDLTLSVEDIYHRVDNQDVIEFIR